MQNHLFQIRYDWSVIERAPLDWELWSYIQFMCSAELYSKEEEGTSLIFMLYLSSSHCVPFSYDEYAILCNRQMDTFARQLFKSGVWYMLLLGMGERKYF